MINTVLIVLSLSITSEAQLASHAHLQFLSHDQLAGRKTATKHANLAASYIAKQFKRYGLAPVSNQFIVPFNYKSGFFSEGNAHNVMAVTDSIANKPTVVITAHFDHLGSSGKAVYNGADDNASGVAALLTLAKLISENPSRQLNYLFLATDAEEAGLFGAREFINNPPIPLSDVLININLDMLGVSKRKRLLALYNTPSKPLVEALKDTNWHTNSKLKFTKGNGFYNSSVKNQRRRIIDAGDHRAFYKKNIPVLYFGVGEHDNYHTVDDTYENIHHGFFDANLHNIAKVISELDANAHLLNSALPN